jgi:general secretion pathway protein K
MNRQKQQGIALVLVLWILILLTVATGAYALMARMDQMEANQLLSGTQARMWAEAGLNIAALALRDPDDETRIMADGRPYEIYMEGVLIETMVWDERGKLDINAADEITLTTLFLNNGLEADEAELLAAAAMDWRDSDEVERVNGAELESYEAAGLDHWPGNRPFMMVEELLQVLGMSYEFYRIIEPGLTIHSNAALPQIGFASAQALMALPDLTPEEALNFVEFRQSQDRDEMLSAVLPNGESVVAQGRGLTYSIRVKATMPNGVWEQVEATIRLGGSPAGLPYRVLRWREGFQY